MTCLILLFNHAVQNTVGLNEMKNCLGLSLALVRNLNNLDWEIEINNNVQLQGQRGVILQQLKTAVERLPGIDTLVGLNLTTTPDIFFEILCSNLHNEILGFQGWVNKLGNAKVNKINRKIDTLKQNFLINANEISLLEQEVTSILDEKLSSKVSNLKIFENLNAEKPTPIFLTLTKKRSSDKLALIRSENGDEFQTEEQRNEYIVGEFEDLYRNRDDNPLGPEIVNNPVVQNSKLTAEESLWLDRPLTLAEIDISAKKGKIRSAPGADGFSNKLIIRCWKFFRLPFFEYVTHCYNTSMLMHM
jgi:hypothetical protein